MKTIKNIINLLILATAFLFMNSCTDLSEELYDNIGADNYYNTHDDVIRAVVRPYEHAYWASSQMFEIQENTADFIATYNREGDWLDGQRYQRQHYHTWTIDDFISNQGWVANFQGIGLANSAIADLNTLTPEDYSFTNDEFEIFIAGLRTLRAWEYINLLDLYRNIPLFTTADPTQFDYAQVEPQVVFDFIESELKESIEKLPIKETSGGNQNMQGQWTKAGAASLLVRLYLNAEKWIGVAKYDECAIYCQRILNGDYGNYEIADRWDEPFDWNNETSDEVIFAFTGALTRTHWHYEIDMYWWSLPALVGNYLGFNQWGNANPKYALQPSLDIDENEYAFELGKPVAKFKKYPEDVRLLKYKNLTETSSREGMFLYGYLEYDLGNGVERVTRPGGTYDLYIRDQVGLFQDADPGVIIDDKESNMNHGDHNSGWHLMKYPIYRDGDPGAIESDLVFIRLAEIKYSLAECLFRNGDVSGAATQLNDVRKRYYPEDKYSDYLYAPEGTVVLDENELLDEWGREFVGESRRRIDLIRWNKFSSGTWWDKQPDADSHTEIFPLSRTALGGNSELVQNPGYESR